MIIMLQLFTTDANTRLRLAGGQPWSVEYGTRRRVWSIGRMFITRFGVQSSLSVTLYPAVASPVAVAAGTASTAAASPFPTSSAADLISSCPAAAVSGTPSSTAVGSSPSSGTSGAPPSAAAAVTRPASTSTACFLSPSSAMSFEHHAATSPAAACVKMEWQN